MISVLARINLFSTCFVIVRNYDVRKLHTPATSAVVSSKAKLLYDKGWGTGGTLWNGMNQVEEAYRKAVHTVVRRSFGS